MKNKIYVHLPSTMDNIVPIGDRGVSISAASTTLAKSVEAFIERNSSVRAAQHSRIAAGLLGTSTVKEFYQYLLQLDFDAEILVGKRYLKQLENPSPGIQTLIEEIGHKAAADLISQGVVRVNDLIIDLLFQKIGTTYKKYNNFPISEFQAYWMYTLDVHSLVEITPEHVKKLMQNTDGKRVHTAAPLVKKLVPNSTGPNIRFISRTQTVR